MGIEKQMVFVLDNISEYQQLIGDVPSSEVYVLDSSGDVLSQMATILANYSDLDAIHLFSHGSSGSLDLGSLNLNSANLNEYAAVLSDIGASLGENGDILLYGCNVAEGQSGVEFISKLSQATGADIAASDDVTGNSAKGGNWILETASGSVETSSITASDFGGVLAPSGSPVYDFEGPTTQVSVAEVTFATSGHTLDVTTNSGVAYTSNSGLNYLNASTSGAGQIHLHFADGETFDAKSIDLREMVAPETQINLMITSNLTDRSSLTWMTDDANNQEMYIFHNNATLNDTTFTTIDLSMFAGATDIYIEGYSGSLIEGIHIDNFTVDFPVANAAPVISYLDGDSVSVAPGDSVVIDADQMPNPALITDSDSANFNNGYLLIHQATGTADGNFSAIESVVLFNASAVGLDGNGTPISASGTPAIGDDVYVSTVAGWVNIGTVDIGQLGASGQSGTDLRIDLNANATPNYTSIILQSLQYSSHTAGVRTFEATANDGSATSSTATFTVDVTGSNNAPINYAPNSETGTEDTALTFSLDNALQVADTDGDTLTVTLSVDHGTLQMAELSDTTNGLTVLDADGLDGTLQFSGSVADINAALNTGFTYYALQNVNGEGAATLSITTDDGTAAPVTDSVSINITPVNDAPTFDIRSGNFDTSFIGRDTDGNYNSDEYASCNASVLLPDGSIINVGDATFDGTPYVALTKLNSDGTPNADFGRGGFKVFDGGSVLGGGGSATSVAVEPDGKIVMSGYSDNGGVFLAILNSDGSSDSIIDVASDLSGNNGIDTDSLYLDYIALQADGKIVLAGGQNPIDGDGGDVVLARYNADGTVDTTFGTNGTVVTNLGNADGCAGITIDANGNILLAVDGGNNSDMGVVKYASTGALDTSFGTSGIAWSSVGGEFNAATSGAIKIQSDGKIVLAGSVQGIDDSDIALARFNADGTLDINFSGDGKTIFGTADTEILRNSGGNDYAHSLGIDASGAIYVGGEYGFHGENADGYIGNASFDSVAKFTSSGALDTNFAQGGMIIPGYVQEGYITVDTQSQDAYDNNYWDSNNDPHGDSGSINSILVQPDGKIVVGGSYSYIDNYDYFYDYSGMTTKRMDTNANLDTHNFGYTADTVADSDTNDFEEEGAPVTIGDSNRSYFTPSVYDVEQNALNDYSGGTLTIHRDGGANSEDVLFFDIVNQTSPFILNGITYGTNGNGTPVLYDINHHVFATYDVSTPGQLVVHFTSEATPATQTLVDAVTASILYTNTNTVNPGGEDGYITLNWLYNDGNESETTSTCDISINETDDGGIEGTVSVSGTPTTGSTLTITGLNTVTDPDLAGITDEAGTVPEDDMSFQWQVKIGDSWENIDGATDSTYEVTGSEGGTQFRVVVGYEDATNGAYTELESSNAQSGGGSSGSSSTPTTPTTPTIVDEEHLSNVVKTAPHTETHGNATVTTQTATATRSFSDDNGHTITQTNKTVEAVQITAPTNSSTTTAPTSVPLYWGESTKTEAATTASVSAGVTLASEGNRAPTTTQTKASAIDDLIYYIQTTVPSTDSTKSNMLGGGSSFLSALNNVNTLVVNKVVLSTASSNSTTPASVSLDGTATAVTTSGVTDTPKEALVIDASSLSSGSTVSLSNIEFGVLTGSDLNVVMTGTSTQTVYTGTGTQTLTTSSLTQNQLYAGGGDDAFHITAPSSGLIAAPKAQAMNVSTAATFASTVETKTALYGEDGNDTTAVDGAGTQNVFVHGGSGNDSIVYGGSMSDYTITRDNGITYVHSNVTSKTDVLLNVESIQFDDGTYTITNNNDLIQIASLYQQVLGRQAEVDGFQYWASTFDNGDSIGAIATSFVRSSEYFNNTSNVWDSMNNDQRIETFYQLMLGRASDAAGKAYWMDAINNGTMSVQDIAGSFVESAEMQGICPATQEWNFTV